MEPCGEDQVIMEKTMESVGRERKVVSNLKIMAMQYDIAWEDKESNLDYIERQLGLTDVSNALVVLPEMFTTGFSMNSQKLAESMDGLSVQWLRKRAIKHQCSIFGSLIIEENNKKFNRGILIKKDGNITTYDKRHLFSMAREHKAYDSGNDRLIANIDGWRICFNICYDLRFPVWSRNDDEYDLLIYIASWPIKRIEHWNVLLRARAIENQAYVLGLNRIGMDGNDCEYSGQSQLIDPMGEVKYNCQNKEDKIMEELSWKNLLELRDRYPFLADKDKFEIKD